VKPRLIVVSPFMEERAKMLAEELDIEFYTNIEDVVKEG
jgi:hypothetical protein